jgi:hypothetical protein
MPIRLILFSYLLLPLLVQAAEPSKSEKPETPAFTKYLLIDLTNQKAKLLDNRKVLWESIVSTGRESNETPVGTYRISDKHEKWVSTLYNVSMPNFQRFNGGTIGIHAGIIPGFPASHGCIRLPEDKARDLFALTEVGLPVVVTGETPPYEYFKAKILQARREQKSPYSKRGTATRVKTVTYLVSNTAQESPKP